MKKLAALVVLLLGLKHPGAWWETALNVAALGCLFLAVVRPTFIKERWRWGVVALISLFTIMSLNNAQGVRRYLREEPADGTYRTDMDDFLKTYYLMRDGNDYYMSYRTAIEKNPFKGQAPTDLWSWRLPTVFYVWQLIPGENGEGIYFLFLAMMVLSLVAASGFVATLSPHRQFAVMAPFLLLPYFHFATRDTTLLQTEWWGLAPMMFGAYFLSTKKFKAATVAFAGAVLVRELFAIPLGMALIASIFWHKKHWWVYALPLMLGAAALAVHWQLVAQTVTIASLAPRIHALGITILLPTLAFASWEYAFYSLRLFLLFYAASLIGFAYIVLFQKRLSESLLLVGSFLLFPLTFLFIGSSSYNDYWGIFYMPMVIISLPALLSLYSPASPSLGGKPSVRLKT